MFAVLLDGENSFAEKLETFESAQDKIKENKPHVD